MATTEEQRREVENLRSMTMDVEQRLRRAAAVSEEILPPGSIPGMLGEAHDTVVAVREILDEMVQKMADTRG